LRALAQILGDRLRGLLVEEDAYYDAGQKEAMNALGVAQFPLRGKGGAASVEEATGADGCVVYVPPPVVAQPGTVVHIPRAALEMIINLGPAVQPVLVDHPRKTKLTIERLSAHKETLVAFGRRLEAGAASLADVVQEFYALNEVAFSQRTVFDGHLARALLAGAKLHGSKGKIIDGRDGKETSYRKLLAAAIVLSQEINKATTHERVGIVLPPGAGALVANLAVVLAGKIPVNLNFTAGKEALESAIKQADIDRFITADEFVRKTQSFPWPPLKRLMFIERILPSVKGRIIKWLIYCKLLPTAVIASMLKLPKKGGDAEAALLFTSGSSGEPKGVALSHRNLLANVNQFSARLHLDESDRLLACLPLFHSFGCTVTLWYPIIEGVSIVSYPSPLEAPKLAELIEKYNVSLLLATPTFLRGYLKRAKKEQLASLKLVVTGAEKLPLALEEEFRKRFGKAVMEGYGLTETSPVSNVNLPDLEPDPARPHAAVMPSRKLGSVGHMIPGVAVKITDPTTDQPLPIDQSGMIWLRGPNIFGGYLKQPRKTEEVLRDGWFRTGDIGRVDGDGFLYIEGRLSRFSKIGGEMVPHETVEDHINKALSLDGENERKIAVVGVPDPDKGEALVLLSTVATEAVKQELINLRYTLLDRGVPSLWIPKRLVRVEHIPVLASGKLDIRACEKIAARVE
jgi:acyl-[acyl-carrier-protein]-phospholipid O-acyltransferase/long-chain-fatty-acid--[acyl-carrier-protein] ligase